MNTTTLVINIVILVVLMIAGYVLNWSGPGFALGLWCGIFIAIIGFRFKYGKWR
jgi:hypothetical protein